LFRLPGLYVVNSKLAVHDVRNDNFRVGNPRAVETESIEEMNINLLQAEGLLVFIVIVGVDVAVVVTSARDCRQIDIE